MLELFMQPEVLASFVSLAVIEIVLGVDNVIFISVASSRLPANQRRQARLIGLGIGMFLRIALLFAISWIVSLTEPLLTIFDFDLSWRDLILIGGGLFLIWKSADEVFNELERTHESTRKQHSSFAAVVAQIMVLDVVFSLDSVITAVGIAEHIEVMIAAIILAVGVMMFFAEGISAFVERHPSAKMLALAMLTMVGFALTADGLHFHVDREYMYVAMLFAGAVEALNLFRQKRRGAQSGKAAEDRR